MTWRYSRARSTTWRMGTNSISTLSPRRRRRSSSRRWKASCRLSAFLARASVGWGKITVLEELRAKLGISHDSIIYMGDGSSDIPVMMHVNQYDGLTIAVSEAKFITRVAKRTVLSDNAMSVLVPVLEKLLRWDSARIRRLFASYGLTLLEWDKMRTDRLTIQDSTEHVSVGAAPQLDAH